MERREALQQKNTESGNLKESVYPEMPEKKLNNYIDLDAVAGDKLNTTNVRSTALYAKINNLDPPYENPVTQSKVQVDLLNNQNLSSGDHSP